MSTLKEWLAASTAKEKARLAKAAGTSVPYLYQLANPSIVKAPNLALALRLVDASSELERKGLPRLTVEGLAHLPDEE